MSLPHARTITVDGKPYQWIVKRKKIVRYVDDGWGNEEPVYNKVVTIQANGKTVQRTFMNPVTPKDVESLIRGCVKLGTL